LSAAIFNGDANRTELSDVSFYQQFEAINNGKLDVSNSQVTYNMARDVLEVRE
jgi:ABC-type amino acid transport substrate-binding protein